MAFFNTATQLASLFTAPAHHDPEKHGKYLDDGQKPIEAFCNDIYSNLREWAVEGSSIFYKTEDHWYEFRVETEGKYKGIVWMTRYDTRTWQRLDSWANRSSVENMGKAFLQDKKDKRVPLFNS